MNTHSTLAHKIRQTTKYDSEYKNCVGENMVHVVVAVGSKDGVRYDGKIWIVFRFEMRPAISGSKSNIKYHHKIYETPNFTFICYAPNYATTKRYFICSDFRTPILCCTPFIASAAIGGNQLSFHLAENSVECRIAFDATTRTPGTDFIRYQL